MPAAPPRLLAISDLHVGYPENREAVAALRPRTAGDWLVAAGDVADRVADVEWALRTLADRFAVVIWVPGNHELWTRPRDPVQSRGAARYQHLVDLCRSLGVLTPEDPYPVWEGVAGPVVIAPLFLLYDYTVRPAGATTKAAGLAAAYQAGVVCTDEALLHPDPYPSREAWCQARVQATRQRLAERDDGLPAVLVNHWPLTREPTDILTHPQFAQWCGTTATNDWHRRFDALAVVYGHLHIPRTTWQDGVRFEEVSMGYPREWSRRAAVPRPPRQILPVPEKIVTRPGGFR
ncbi:MAG: metallophosphoesterase family protein [Streptosporangiaceae bacterium]